MKYLIVKDKKRRIFFEQEEIKRISLKILSKDKRIKKLNRFLFRLKLSDFFKKNMSKTRIKNRCLFTGRGRSTFRYFRMSRLHIRELGLRGLLYGIRKSSW